MSKNKDLVKNSIIIAIGKFATQFISLLLLPIYTIYLSPEELGLVDLVLTYVALLVPALTLQIEMAAFRFLIDVRDNEHQKKIVISNVVQIVSLMFMAILVIGVLVAMITNISYILLIIINICVVIYTNLFLQFARGLGDNKCFTKASILSGVTTLLGTILFVIHYREGAVGVLVVMILANFVCALYLFWALKLFRYISFRNRNMKFKKQLLQYSLPLVPNGLSWWVISVSDRTIITIFLGLAANGIYAVSAKYAMIFASIFAIFSLALTESASLHINSKDSAKFLSDANNTSIKLFGALGLLLIVLCPYIFKWLIGPEFQEASNYVPILIVAALFNAIVGVYSAIYVAKKMTKQVATTSMIAAVINIGLTVLFISIYGIYAAAIATAVAFLVMAIYRHFDIKKIVHIKYEKWLLLKIALAYTIVISIFYFNSPIGNIINLLIVGVMVIVLNKSLVIFAKNIIYSSGFLKRVKTS